MFYLYSVTVLFLRMCLWLVSYSTGICTNVLLDLTRIGHCLLSLTTTLPYLQNAIVFYYIHVILHTLAMYTCSSFVIEILNFQHFFGGGMTPRPPSFGMLCMQMCVMHCWNIQLL